MSTRESTFTSFLVFDGNRRAHDLCLAVSRGDPVSPLPLILLGERGSGKTHLLRSVAQRLRASHGHAAIVFLSPQSKLDEIDRLVADPKRIDMARYAVLLIDDFPALSETHEKLAQVVRIFLENDHPVILASDVHPERLGKLPSSLLRIVRGGQVVALEGGEAAAAIKVVEAGVREAERETVVKLQERITELESAGPEGVAREHAQRAAILEALTRDLAEARREIEHLRGENALHAVAAREAVVLRQKLDELERAQIERASRPLEDTTVLGTDELKRNLDEARYDAQKAREEARGMLERAQQMVATLHSSRESYEVARREHDRQREDIRRFQGLTHDGTDDEAAAVSAGAPAELAAGEVAHSGAANLEERAAQEELQRLQESLVRARAERDNAKSHLSHIRHELDTALADLERLRTDTAETAVAHAAREHELETALLARQTEIEQLQELQRAFTEEVRALQSQVTEGADVLERLMELFGCDAPGDDPADAAIESDLADPAEAVVRADFGEGIRLVPRRPSLHHIEEMRGRATTFFPPNLPPLDDAGNDVEDRAASA